MKVAEFDYPLPEELVAQEPANPRDSSRLMALRRAGGPPLDLRFGDLPDLLAPGDLLVFNDTRVIPARLLGRKPSGGRCELLLVEPLDEPGARWRTLARSSKALRPGSRLAFGDLAAAVEEDEGEGFFAVRFDRSGDDLLGALEREGRVPLPPYIRREPAPEDRERYQTVLARAPGSVAAPTAGLHFTAALLDRLASRGIERTWVTLHIGPGTFLPVRSEEVEGHRMHEERYQVPEAAAAAFEACRRRGGRVVAVGTTALRALESAYLPSGRLRPGWGRTALFIRPGYHFRTVDGLITNFHLPRSTLLMLVCAFGGRDRVLDAYRRAVAEGYRFYSYGDAMIVI